MIVKKTLVCLSTLDDKDVAAQRVFVVTTDFIFIPVLILYL